MNGWKTYAAALVMAVAGALAQSVEDPASLLDPQVGKGLLMGAVVTGVMRWLTSVTTVKQALETEPPKGPQG